MLWEEYYDKIWEWSTSTAVSRMSQLETFGPSNEITEVITEIAFSDEKGALRLFKKALAAGVKFSGEELEEISLYSTELLLKQAVMSSASRFTTADLEILYGICDDDLLLHIAKKHNIQPPNDLACCEDSGYAPQELYAQYDDILLCLSNALEYLDIAMTYSTIDFSSNSRYVTLRKYAALEDAQNQLSYALNAWERLDVPAQNKKLLDDVLPNIGLMTVLQDFSHGGFLTNYLVNKRILEIDKNIRFAIQTIIKLRDSLTD